MIAKVAVDDINEWIGTPVVDNDVAVVLTAEVAVEANIEWG